MASSLPCKLVAGLAFKASGDIFHQIVAKNPHGISELTPTKVQACNLHEGSYGTNGSIIQWEYTLDGKTQTAKQVLQDIDEEKKHIGYKMIEGNLLELYKDMTIALDVETKDGVDFITWTVEYELINAENPHPLSLINFFMELTKEVEAHLSG